MCEDSIRLAYLQIGTRRMSTAQRSLRLLFRRALLKPSKPAVGLSLERIECHEVFIFLCVCFGEQWVGYPGSGDSSWAALSLVLRA